MLFRALISALLALVGCTQDKPTTNAPHRVGRTFSNGNCALDSNNKLTGFCVGSDGSGTKCIAHQPDSESKPCPAGVAVTETRVAPCARDQGGELVSRPHECFFVQEP